MTLVCPYFINTGMFSGCKPKNFPMLEPKDVAKRMIIAIRTREVFVTMPGWARYLLPLKKLVTKTRRCNDDINFFFFFLFFQFHTTEIRLGHCK